MAVTIKRKSLKKSSKKNVRSRKLGNKTRKNMKNSSSLKGGNREHFKNKKLPHATREHIKSSLLEAHGKRTPSEITSFKKNRKDWTNLKQEAEKHIIDQQIEQKRVFTPIEIKDSIIGRKQFQNSQKEREMNEVLGYSPKFVGQKFNLPTPSQNRGSREQAPPVALRGLPRTSLKTNSNKVNPYFEFPKEKPPPVKRETKPSDAPAPPVVRGNKPVLRLDEAKRTVRKFLTSPDNPEGPSTLYSTVARA